MTDTADTELALLKLTAVARNRHHVRHMRRANLEEHYWQLESGEARHAAYPDEFAIPARAERDNLRRGQAAKLLFELEGEAEETRSRPGA